MSTSSRRSSRSTKSTTYRSPPWRSSTAKGAMPTNLTSFVVAEPELESGRNVPAARALESLGAVSREEGSSGSGLIPIIGDESARDSMVAGSSTSSIDPTTSTTSDSLPPQQLQAPTSTSDPAADLAAETPSNSNPSVDPDTSTLTRPSLSPLPPKPLPPTTSPMATPPSSPPSSSWFGSLSRSKGKSKLSAMQTLTSASEPILPIPQSDSPQEEGAHVRLPSYLPEPSKPELHLAPLPAAPFVQVQPPTPGVSNDESLVPPAEAVASAPASTASPEPPFVPTPTTTASAPQPIPTATPARQVQTRRSWFASSSPSSTRSLPSSPRTGASPPRPAPISVATSPEPLRTISALPPNPAVSAPTTLQTAAAAAAPHAPLLLRNESMGIDEEVPRLPASPPLSPPLSASPVSVISVQSNMGSLHSVASNPLSPPMGTASQQGASRFMLSLPLLGRAKMPLPVVVPAKSAEETEEKQDKPSVIEEVAKLAITKALQEQDDAFVSPLLDDSSLPQSPSDLHSPGDAVPKKSMAGDSSPLPPTSLSNPPPYPSSSSSSWWELIGWSSSALPTGADTQPVSTSGATASGSSTTSEPSSSSPSTVTQASPSAPGPPPSPSEAPTTPSRDRDTATAPGSSPSTPSIDQPGPGRATASTSTSTSVSTSTSAPAAGEASKDSDDRPKELKMETGDQCAGNSSRAGAGWLAPWAWYSYSSASPNPDGSEGDGEGENQEQETRDERGSGDATRLETRKQETTMAGDAAGETSEALGASDDGSTPTQEQIVSFSSSVNPIESTIETNRSGWASFFSSRALMIKTLGYGSTSDGAAEGEVKRDEDGNEIMDLDESDDEGERGRELMKAQLKVGDGVKGKVLGSEKQSGKSWNGKRGAPSSHVGATEPNASIKSNGAAPAAGLDDGDGSGTSGGPNGDADLSKLGNVIVSDNRKEGKGKQPIAPPLTVSDAIRRETLQSSPANKENNDKLATGKKSPKPGSGATTPVPPSPTSSVASTTAPTNTKVDKNTAKRTASPAPSVKKVAVPAPPNLVLPTWQDTFHTSPRNKVSSRPDTEQENDPSTGVGGKLLGRTMKFVSGVLFPKDEAVGPRKGKERDSTSLSSLLEMGKGDRFAQFGKELPRAWHVIEEAERTAIGRKGARVSEKSTAATSESEGEIEGMTDILKGCRRVAVIGVHGWFPGAMMRTVLGEPTGTSGKFVNMMVQALEEFEISYGVKLEKITKIPLEGEGTIDGRVEKLYASLRENQEWMDDLHTADAIFVATHSQGSVVSTHLLDRLIRDRHIRTAKNSEVIGGAESFPSAAGGNILPAPKPQRVCCLALCGIHLGPLRYLSSSSLLQPYIQYFESTAARELFEFQNTESAVSKAYVQALRNVVYNGTKMVYVASLNDQVVPVYSGLFTAVSHPLILRALYIDGDAYHSSDFLSNLLVLLLRILNTSISDSGLLAHLSEATAGSLNGVGHSTAYEELATYSLAVKYLFLTDNGSGDHPELLMEPFNAMHEQNDYEIPWALRDVIADERVSHFFSREITELRDAFREWHPKTTILRDLKRKLQPIQRLPSSFSSTASTSKL